MTEKAVYLEDTGGQRLWTFRDVSNVGMRYYRDVDQYYTGAEQAEIQFEITQTRVWTFKAKITGRAVGSGEAYGDNTVERQLTYMRNTVMSEHDKMTLFVTHPDDSVTSVTGTIESFDISMLSGRATAYDYTLIFREAEDVWEV